METNDCTTQGTLNIGSVVELVTNDNRKHTGKVLAYDYCAQLLFIQKEDADTQNMSIFNVSYCKKFNILQDEKSNQQPCPLAKALFEVIVRQFDANSLVWEGDTIVIVRTAYIYRPYLVFNVVAMGLPKTNRRVRHILRLVRHFHETYAAKLKKAQPQKKFFVLENVTKGNAVSEYRFGPNCTFIILKDDNNDDNIDKDEEKTEKVNEKMVKKPSENEDKPDEEIAAIVAAPKSAKPEDMTYEEVSKTQFQLNENLASVENDEKLTDNSNNVKDKTFRAVSTIAKSATGAKLQTLTVQTVAQSEIKAEATFRKQKLNIAEKKLQSKVTNNVQHITKNPAGIFRAPLKKLDTLDNIVKPKATNIYRNVTKNPAATSKIPLKKLDTSDTIVKPKATNIYQNVTKKIDNNPPKSYILRQQQLAEERANPKSKPSFPIINRKADAGGPASKLAANKVLTKSKTIIAIGLKKTSKIKPTLTKVELASKLDGPPLITDNSSKARPSSQPATFR